MGPFALADRADAELPGRPRPSARPGGSRRDRQRHSPMGGRCEAISPASPAVRVCRIAAEPVLAGDARCHSQISTSPRGHRSSPIWSATSSSAGNRSASSPTARGLCLQRRQAVQLRLPSQPADARAVGAGQAGARDDRHRGVHRGVVPQPLLRLPGGPRRHGAQALLGRSGAGPS